MILGLLLLIQIISLPRSPTAFTDLLIVLPRDTEQSPEAKELLLTADSATALSIIDIVNSMFEQAVQQRASDIHLEPNLEGGQVRFRIDGLLHPQIRFRPSGVCG